MRVFLSWSGDRSRYVAEQFSDWLPVVIQSVDTFMSEHDVEAGSRWAREIDDHLEATDFGILFVTPENQEEPWLLHEAGALGKSVEESRVVPVTIEMAPADVDWPLARFQGVNLEEDGVRELVDSINSALEEDQLEPNVLERAFDTNWPMLREDLEDIPPLPEDTATVEDTPDEAQRRRDEKLDEVLELVRSMSRRGAVEDFSRRVLRRLGRLDSRSADSEHFRGEPREKVSDMAAIRGEGADVQKKYALRGNPEDIETFQKIFPGVLGEEKLQDFYVPSMGDRDREYMLDVFHLTDEEEVDEAVAIAAEVSGVKLPGVEL